LIVPTLESVESLPQHLLFVDNYLFVIYTARGSVTPSQPWELGEKPFLIQSLRTNEDWIPGEDREGIVRRVARTSWRDRQDLPVTLPGFREDLRESECRRTKISDAKVGRK
jgi:hypothetical protein